jgi:hypothetical protein
LFQDAEFPIEERCLLVDPDNMRTAGATLLHDLSFVPDAVSMLFASPTESQLEKKIVFRWSKTGVVWALVGSNPEQYQALKEGGYDFQNYNTEDRCHGLLEDVGARFYENPEDGGYYY